MKQQVDREARKRRRRLFRENRGSERIRQRVLVLTAGCCVAGSLILVQAFRIQILRDDRLERLAQRQFHSKVLVRPRRGLILDREGKSLAVNLETRSLAANPQKIQDKYSMAKRLSKIPGVSFKRIYRRLKSNREFVWVKRHIHEEELKRFKGWGLLDRQGEVIEGFWLVNETKRVYPLGEVAAHVIGDVNVDSDGIEGVELWMNELMRGRVAPVKAVRDALGRPSFIDAKQVREGKDGQSVSLTLDAALQYSIEARLRDAIRRHEAKSGVVIAMDARSGEILALANQPSFNPNSRSKAPSDHRRNRALTDGFEPGSILKPVLLASALSHGWSVDRKYSGGGGSIVIQGRRIGEADEKHSFQALSLLDMIKFSSNVVSARLALDLGAKRYLQTLHEFGFGSKTGVGFPGEISGWVPSPNTKIPPLSLANIGFGQGILVTALQMTRAFAVFANGGYRVEPRLLIESPSTPPVRVLDANVARKMTETLIRVTQENGSGVAASIDGFGVAGKTGTAQVVDPATKKYSRKHYIASFVGYAVDVEPSVVILVSIDRPRGAYYASQVAAPLFREVLQEVIRHYRIPLRKSRDSVPRLAERREKQPQQDEIRTVAAAPLGEKEIVGEKLWKMPDLTGLSSREVLRVLTGRDFRIRMKGFGTAKEQTPAPGAWLAEGDLIEVKLE